MPTVIADWDDVRDRAEADRPDGGTRLPSRRVVAIAAMVVLAGLLVAPAVALGDQILALIDGKSTPGDVQTPAWAPDGRKLAFVSERDGDAEIYVMKADGSAQENLTRQPANDSHPSWSPNGRKIAFVSRRDGNAEIYVMNADGSGQRNVTRTPSSDLDPAWSPDGRAIAFVQKKPKRASETYLYVVNADGSGLRRLTTRPAHLLNPSWSADGKTIRYGRYLVHADGSGQPELPRNVPLAGAWSPDGQRIAFAVAYRTPRVPETESDAGLWVVNADGSGARRVARKAAGAIPRGLRTVAGSPSGGSTANSDRPGGLRPLSRERRRERAATADTPCGEPALVRVVTRRADDRLPPQQGGVHRKSRRKWGTEAHAAQRIARGQAVIHLNEHDPAR